MKKTIWKELLVLLFCVIAGFTLRFHNFDKKSLWLDEVYTFNDSRDGLNGQIKFYKENPAFLHPPLFFILTHLSYPFTKPERDLRIVPLIFGTLSIPMIYLLSRSFSSLIAIPCTISLTLMAYHISLSQDARSYSLLMFLGMGGLYFFMLHLKTTQKRYLVLVALSFALSFLTSYSSIPFILFSQLLWFYRPSEAAKKPTPSSFFILNGLTVFLCLPWVIFLRIHYGGQPLMDPFHGENPGTFVYILYGILNDWLPHTPLMVTSTALLILFPLLSKNRRNALILLGVLVAPIGGLYLFCKSFHITHFIASRYFINLLPVSVIALFLSLDAAQARFERLKRFVRPQAIFVIFFITSNLIILPAYYRSEKQDFRGLANYLKGYLIKGDNIFDWNRLVTPGVLHYFGIFPEGRHYTVSFSNDPEKGVQIKRSFIYRNNPFTIYYAAAGCGEYVSEGGRLWIVAVGGSSARQVQSEYPALFAGYFDGSFLNQSRFPTDGSLYLFLLDPRFQRGKGGQTPIQ